MLRQIARDLLMLLVTIDPIGTVALFVPLTAGLSSAEGRAVARKAVLIAAVVLLGFLAAGEILLSHLGIRLVSFQLAGGVILFLFAVQMIFGSVHGGATQEPGRDVAVFPLALPGIASPGAITAVVLLTDNHRFSLGQQVITAVVLCVVLAFTLGLLYAAGFIHRLLGNTGANVLIRVLGLILAALASEQIVGGIEALRRAAS